VARACASLGIKASENKHITTTLCKLVLYGEGARFSSHAEVAGSSPGMFGTLVVQLPAFHVGGALEVRHAGRAVSLGGFDGGRGADGAFYQAFFAGCAHIMQPITEVGPRRKLSIRRIKRAVFPSCVPPKLPKQLKVTLKFTRRGKSW
jgi:hypothetical protein